MSVLDIFIGNLNDYVEIFLILTITVLNWIVLYLKPIFLYNDTILMGSRKFIPTMRSEGHSDLFKDENQLL